MENYRAYPLGKKKVLSEPVYATALYGGTEHVESLSFVFLNLGDMPVQRADRGGRIEKVTDDELRVRMASCVERRDNGDVSVRNVPMVDQGPKGYCSPATWERYLRYLDIPADMYLLALAANTGAGGGTYSPHMIEATKNIISSNGRKLKDIDSKPTLDNVAKYIDMGLPIMWRFRSTPSFQAVPEPSTLLYMVAATGSLVLRRMKQNRAPKISNSKSGNPKFSERWGDDQET